jgi:molybdenum-dependent DNA-binding transcriptional regulator ModE
MTYFPSHSYEQMYQAIRRMWRFGQQNTVEVNLITTPGGEKVLANLKRKSDQAVQMFKQLVAEMNNALSIRRTEFENEMEIPSWLK